MNAVSALWSSLRSLRGNQRACVITEPMWAIPYNLFLPFASVYMSGVGLSDAQIGAVASLSLAAQFAWGFLSGALVDKYGRRASMLTFGLLSWTIPCALWALAKGYWYFAAAAALNGMWRVTGNSFSCMIVEDGDTGRLVHIYTALSILGLAAGFLSPLMGLCIGSFSLVPAMRALYALALVSMTAKFLLQYRISVESGVGRRRMAASGGSSALTLTLGGWPAFTAALRHRPLRLCALMMVLMTCFNVIQANFWPLFIRSGYGVGDAALSAFPMVKAVATLLVYGFITPRVSLLRVRRPLLAGIGAQGIGLAALLVFSPMGTAAVWAVFFSAVCDAFALAVLGPLTESMMSVSIPGEERARINGMIISGILLVSAPAGWAAGQAATLDRAFPLAINLCLIALEALVAIRLTQAENRPPCSPLEKRPRP